MKTAGYNVLPCNPSDFPNNSQLAMHFKEFLKGYRSSAESIITKFPYSDGSRRLEDFSVGCVDGFSKILLMLAIVSFVDELEMTPEAIASSKTLSHALQSFSLVRCCYEHRESPQQLFLDSLRNLARTVWVCLKMRCPFLIFNVAFWGKKLHLILRHNLALK